MKKGLIILSLIAIGAISIGTWNGCKPSGKYAGKVEKLKLGVATTESSSLIYIAEAMGFFKNHGLDASIKDYEAGALAVTGLTANEVDVATAAEFVLVTKAFEREDLKAVSAIAGTKNCELIARKDKRIKNPSDLNGKKVATVRGSGLDFFLLTFLTLNNLSPNTVTLVDLKPSQAVESILSGTVDAVATFTPYSRDVKKGLGANALAWPIQGMQDFYFLLITREEYIKVHSPAIGQLLQSLIDAEQFTLEHEGEAQKIIGSRLRIDPADLQSVWRENRFQVRLDQDLLTLMEHEARWAMRNRITDQTKMPNFLKVIYLSGLERIKPEAVTIIH